LVWHTLFRLIKKEVDLYLRILYINTVNEMRQEALVCIDY